MHVEGVTMRSDAQREIEDFHDFYDALADIQADIDRHVKKPLETLINPNCRSDPETNARLIKMAVTALHERNITGLLAFCMAWLASETAQKALADMERSQAAMLKNQEVLAANSDRLNQETYMIEHGIETPQRQGVDIRKTDDPEGDYTPS